jgi:plastocyanin
MRLLHLRSALAMLAIGAILAGSPLAAADARAASHTILISDFTFAPATLTVTVGDTVTWTNMDPVIHTATANSGAFDTGDLAQGESGSITFTEAGTFSYICTPHPSMTGTIVVQAAAPAPSAGQAPPPSGGGLPDVSMPPPDDRAPLSPMQVVGLALVVLAVAIRTPRRRRAES